MNKTAIKNFAIWARVQLIEAAKQKAFEYEITSDTDSLKILDSVNGRVLTSAEKSQRRELIAVIREKGFEQVMEEVAYTWFNRFIALRYMEVNNYLPSKVRVFTDENGDFKPAVMKEAMTVELDGIRRDTVFELLDKQDNERLFKYLIITQCNTLSTALPYMFEKISNYTELLFPNNLLRPDSVIAKMVDKNTIPEEDWTDQIEIIGWLFQYYISEKHDQIINIYKGTIKKNDIPAATQLFTTKWVVQYMVDNSLGRYWIERNPDSKLREKLEYFVTPKDGNINYIDERIAPEQITFFDPCMGSGHILVYAFDVLMEIYRECGYSDRDAAESIIENNIYGVDIDDRAFQLAYFAVMMKARSYNRRILSNGITPNILSINESGFMSDEFINYVAHHNGDIRNDLILLKHVFKDAKELGSILRLPDIDISAINARISDITESFAEDLMSMTHCLTADEKLRPLLKQARILSNKYTVVCTNPPYMNKFEGRLKSYLNENYKDYCGDMFSVFIFRNFDYCKKDGYSAFMTPFVWMFIKTYEKLREYIVSNKAITSLIQMEYSAFEEATVPICSFILQNRRSDNKSLCFRLSDFKGGMEVQKTKVLEAIADKNCGYFYEAEQSNFSKIPGSPVAYWVSEKFVEAFEKGITLGDKVLARNGMKTGDNDKFLRLWWEIEYSKANIACDSAEKALISKAKWFPYNKGGEYRKWYGNNDYLVDWENQGEVVIGKAKEESRHVQDYPKELKFIPSASWSLITSSDPSFRFKQGNISDIAGMSFFANDNKLEYYLGFCNTKISLEILRLIAPTINFQAGDIARLPIIFKDDCDIKIKNKVENNIDLSKSDWDSFETSWDFKKHPLV